MRTRKAYILAGVLLGSVVAFGAVAGSSGTHAQPEIQRALRSLRRGQYAHAERAAVTLATRGDAPARRSWMIVAAARQRRGKFASAARAYRLFLGSCGSAQMRSYVLEQMRLCQAALTNPSPPEAPSKRLTRAKLEELARVSAVVHIDSSEHFVIRARNAILAKLLTEEAESILNRICNVILPDQEYPHSVDIRVWADPDEFSANAPPGPEWSGGSFTITSRDGILTRRIDLTQRTADGRFDTMMLDRVLPHEMCHLVLKEYFGDAPHPLLLEEGLAMLAEASVDNERVLLTGMNLTHTGAPRLNDLLTADRDDMDDPPVFYAKAFSFTEFLHSHLSRSQFAALLEHIKAGCTFAVALQRALYVPPDDRFLSHLGSTWKRHAISQAQFLQALCAKPTATDKPID